jgi:hypothetical protein
MNEYKIYDEKIVYKIVDNETGLFATAYSRSYHDVEEWNSKDSAVNSNVHGVFKDEAKYSVKKYRVTYEEII